MFRKAYLLIPALVFMSFSPAECEVKLDGSLGTSGNVQGPNYSIEAAMGKQMGASLFHSFEKFDINTGENAIFKGPADVERIISRVTGGNPSRIDGAIRSEIQGADFYFINPFGMIFGPNASLDITGSFFATSADYLKLGENGRFDARNPENTVLTSDAPEAFGFLGQKPGDIIVESKRQTGTDVATGKPEYSGLEVNGGNRMMLAGGDIKIDKGIVQSHSGSLDVASVSSAGELDIESPDVKAFESLGKLEVLNEGHVYSKGGGDIKCQAGSVEVNSNSVIETSAHDEIPKAGDVTVNARDSVTVSGSGGGFSSGIGSFVDNISDAGFGNVFINAVDVKVSDAATIYLSSIGSGDSGNIILDVARLRLLDGGRITASITGGNGMSGDIDITASESVNISGFYQKGRSVYSSGIFSKAHDSENASLGNISVRVPDFVIEKNGVLSSESLNAGDSGNIILEVASLSLLNGGQISSSITGGSGKSGDVDIKASESIKISGFYGDGHYILTPSKIFSEASESKKTKSGSLSIRAPEILIEKFGFLSTNSWRAGNAGNIYLEVARLNLLEGGKILSDIDAGDGKAGNIDIISSELINISGSEPMQTLFNHTRSRVSGISSENQFCLNTQCVPGKISITAPEVTINYGFISSESYASKSQGGSIALDVANLNLLGGGYIISSNELGKGSAGDIEISASDSIVISGFHINEKGILQKSGILSTAIDSLDSYGANIYVESPYILIDNCGVISSKSIIAGNSGNIYLRAAKLHLLDGGQLDSSAINSELVKVQESRKIVQTSGNAGSIDIILSDSIVIYGYYKYYIGDLLFGLYRSGIKSWVFDSKNNLSCKLSIKAPEMRIDNHGSIDYRSLCHSMNAGNIYINVDRLNVLNGGLISSTIEDGNGKSGDIYIIATESVNISGYSSGIVSEAIDSENSSGGAINIFSPETEISNGGTVSCSSRMAGPAGSIYIEGDRFINFSGSVDTSADSSGGGNIFFNIKDFFFMDNNASVSTAVVGGAGSGGNIIITEPDLSVLRSSSIKSSAIGGYGGNIDITADYFIKDDASILNASSEIGLNGKIDINSPDIDLNSGLIKLSEKYQDPASFIKDPCIGRMEGKSSSLTSGNGLTRRRNPFSYFESSYAAQ